MAHNVFSVPIFFIVFRETLEATIIVAVLLGLVEQIVYLGSHSSIGPTLSSSIEGSEKKESGQVTSQEASDDEDGLRERRLIRKMRFQE